jgi:trehalose-6-phosphate synthase
VITSAAEWRRLFPHCCILAGIDSIERLKGVSLKLAAMQAFFEAHPSFIGKVVLVQICVENTVRPGDTQQPSLNEIRALTDLINAKFGSPGLPAIHLLLRESVPLAERLALWAAADCHVNTAIRDGLNMLPFEYAWVRGGGFCIPNGLRALREGAAGSEENFSSRVAELRLSDLPPGCMVLSEFSGCSRVLSGALSVNPFRLEEVTAALLHAGALYSI